jgi:hypothetical protein
LIALALDVTNVQNLCDLSHVGASAPVSLSRRTADHIEVAQARKVDRKVVGDALSEAIGRRVARRDLEPHDSDGRD